MLVDRGRASADADPGRLPPRDRGLRRGRPRAGGGLGERDGGRVPGRARGGRPHRQPRVGGGRGAPPGGRRSCTTASSTTPGWASTSSRATTSSWALEGPAGDRARADPDRAGDLRRRRGQRRHRGRRRRQRGRALPRLFSSTRSEIVVPIAYEGRVVGEIDIDSDVPAAFGPEADRAFLERVALLISPHCLVGWDTGGVPWPEPS